MVLGLSERTVRNVCMQYDKGTGSFSSPKKRYSSSRVRKDADNFDREALRRMIHSFYEKKENLTLHKILVNNHAEEWCFHFVLQRHAKEQGIFSGERTSLRRVLRDMGFKHMKINNKK